MDVSPAIDKLESDLNESKEKVKILSQANSILELTLKDANSRLQLSNKKCFDLEDKNKRLSSTEKDLSKQVYSKFNIYTLYLVCKTKLLYIDYIVYCNFRYVSY